MKTTLMAAHWVRSRLTGGALILGYHRVAAVNRDPHRLCVQPQNFEEQLAVLRRLARPLPLPELVAALQDGCAPERAVAVTFDDGYADVFYRAYPLLERYHVPATLFVATGCLGGAFWWDAAAAGTERGSHAARALTSSELQSLATHNLFHIGAHSVSHPALAMLPPGEQHLEIKESKAALQDLLDRPVHGFSYPHGSASQLTRELVRRSGYAYACASINGVAHGGSDLFHLPRFWPGDWDGERFERWLSRWLTN